MLNVGELRRWLRWRGACEAQKGTAPDMRTIAVLAALTRHLTAVLAVGLLITACGAKPLSQASTGGAYQSGSRLRAHIYDGGGGAALLLWWADETLQMPCTFAAAGDGTIRCLPLDATTVDGSTFLDSSCTQPAVVVDPSGPPTPFVVEPAPSNVDACSAPTPTYLPLGPLQVGASIFFQSGGTCYPGSVPTGYQVFTLGAPADLSVFASAAIVTEARGSALDVQILDGEDGSSQLWQVIDHARQIPCVVVDRPAGALLPAPQSSCLPQPWGTHDAWFSDPACLGQQYANSSAPFCGPTPTFATNDVGVCPEALATQIIPLGPQAMVPSIYVDYPPPTGCVEIGTIDPTQQRLYPELSGAPTGLGATGVTEVGSGRLQAPLFTAAGDPRPLAPGPSGAFLDAQRQVLCVPALFDDGAMHCVPNDVVSFGGTFFNGSSSSLLGPFADTSCTMQLAYGLTSGCQAPSGVVAFDASGGRAGARAVTGPTTVPPISAKGVAAPPPSSAATSTSGPSAARWTSTPRSRR